MGRANYMGSYPYNSYHGGYGSTNYMVATHIIHTRGGMVVRIIWVGKKI